MRVRYNIKYVFSDGAICLPFTNEDVAEMLKLPSSLTSPMIDLELVKDNPNIDLDYADYDLDNSTQVNLTQSPEVEEDLDSRRRRDINPGKPCVREKMYISFAGK